MNTDNISQHIDALFPCKPFRLISSTDRYGFTDILREQFGLRWRPRSFATWVHGWAWWEATRSEELAIKNTDKEWMRCVVANAHEKELLESEGFKHIWIGGLPFAYTFPSNLTRFNGSLLAMLPHSTESERLNKHCFEYLDYIESIKNNYSSVYVSVYYLDKSDELISEISKRGLSFIDGARPDDANSLKRMRAIFDSFEFVTSNTMGSHIIYSLYSGCKTSLCGPMYSYDESIFLANGSPQKHSNEYIQQNLYILSNIYLMSNFQFLFTETPINGFYSEEYGKQQVGYYNKLNNIEIKHALQWHWRGQIRNYSAGAMRRLQRFIKSTT